MKLFWRVIIALCFGCIIAAVWTAKDFTLAGRLAGTGATLFVAGLLVAIEKLVRSLDG